MPARRLLAAAGAAITFFAAAIGSAYADGITNTLDATVDVAAESMPLNIGGGTGTTNLVWIKEGGGGNGCDLTGQQIYRADVVSSNPAVATVSPTSVTFSSCGDIKPLTVTPLTIGSTTISLRQTANTSDYAVDIAPATFTVNVAPPANSAPVVAVTGVTLGSSYPFGAVPTAGCAVSDAEDGHPVVNPVLTAISGPDASSGIGSRTATCTYQDTGGLTATSSATYSIVRATTTTTVTCTPTSVVYDGSAQTPCTATVTGNSLSTSAPVTYSANTTVGTVTASASYAGSATHTASTGSATFSITKAPSTTTVTCPSSVPWTGSALTPCTAKVVGAGGLNQAITPSYAANTAVGTATASASFGGDDNHTGSTGSKGFDIVRAGSVVAITCTPDQVYSGAALTPCTATVTSAGGFTQALPVTYGNNVGAGTATASASFGGDDSHAPASDSTSFAIAKAPSSVTVTCQTTSVTYTGSAQLPCTASASGAGLSTPVTLVPTATGNTDAGTAHVSASWSGDANHAGSSGTATFEISKAASTITVKCPESKVYTGAALEPCTASVSGAGIESDLALTPSYSDNVNVGKAAVSASWAGDANHTAADDGLSSFEITKATSTVTVTCNPATVTYTGSPRTPCSATATGAGISVPVVLTTSYVDNTNAGIATASAGWAGDANHEGDDDASTFTIDKAPSVVAVTCPIDAVTYNGTAQTPCSAKVTGVGGLTEAVSPIEYENNRNAGTASASATYAGDANHLGDSDTATFAIGRYTPLISVDCPEGITYDGQSHTCTATVKGVGDELASAAAALTYTGSTVNAGDVSVHAVYTAPEDGNYSDGSGVGSFTIDQYQPTITLTCPTGAQYDGTAHECTATISGVGSELVGVAPPVTYSANGNTNAGHVIATADYEGGGNYKGATKSTSFDIAKAKPTVTVTCPTSSVQYDAAAHTCSGNVQGVGHELDGATVDIDYGIHGNIDAGDVLATGTYAGNLNYEQASGTGSFTITKAPSAVTVTCDPSSLTYTGTALRPCTAAVTGIGGLSTQAVVAYVDNTEAGTAKASASYAGDNNHTASTGDATFTIVKANTTVKVTCQPGPFTYDGTAFTPCTARATGAGGLSVGVTPVTYTGNTDAGTATASATYAGDSNHNGASGNTTFSISKAPSSVTVLCTGGPYYFTGSPITPTCSARATGAGGLDTAVTPVTFSDNTLVGTATASATYAGDANHLGNTGSGTFTISSWTAKGFYQPVDMGSVLNTVKAGSTVPLKFEIFSGSTEQTNTSAVKSFGAKQIVCTTTPTEDAIELTTTGGTTLRYDTTAGQFVQNWQTPKAAPGTCYQVTMTASDDSRITAYFKLK